MNGRFFPPTWLAGLFLILPAMISSSQQMAGAMEPNLDRVLGVDQPDCMHVIDLLVRNRARRLAGYGAVAGPNVLGMPQPGDLELLEVLLVSQGTAGNGPVYQISFRNTSHAAVHNFQISIVGVLERIAPHSPCRSLRVGCIEAGATSCLQIELPARCMTLGPPGGPFLPFDTLVVALDSLDELVECNELNNVAIVNRAEIGVLAAEAPAATAPQTTDPSVTAPAPAEKAKPSPIENLDLDKLDLDDAQETAARIG